MKRFTVLIAIAAVLAIGAGPWVWNTFISPRPQLELDPLKYAEDSSWSALPVEETAPVWVDGWGVDVFLVSEDSALKGTTQSELQKRELRGRRQAQSLKDHLGLVGEVYAPLYRDNATHDDLTRAFESYLATIVVVPWSLLMTAHCRNLSLPAWNKTRPCGNASAAFCPFQTPRMAFPRWLFQANLHLSMNRFPIAAIA